jgi:hypothetical protein
MLTLRGLSLNTCCCLRRERGGGGVNEVQHQLHPCLYVSRFSGNCVGTGGSEAITYDRLTLPAYLVARHSNAPEGREELDSVCM